MKGTITYSSPEQIDQKQYGRIDWRTDIFQLGILFYEMLTGNNPFYDEGQAAILNKILNAATVVNWFDRRALFTTGIGQDRG